MLIKKLNILFLIFFILFSLSRNISSTLQLRRSNKDYQCCLCSKSFTSEIRLLDHVEKLHYNDIHQPQKYTSVLPVACISCNKRFTDKFKLKKHQKDQELKNYSTYICSKCGLNITNTPKLIRKHEATHKSYPKTYDCAHCKSTFKSRGYLLNHIRTHVQRKLSCHECGRLFTRTDHLKTHIQVVHNSNDAEYFRCDLCDFKSFLKQNLRVHMLVHLTGENRFQCKYCEKVYNYKCDLKRHVYRHENTSPYKCDVCLKSFYSKSNLNVHRKTHLGIKEYKCDVCEQRFSQNVSLLNHCKTIHKKHETLSAVVKK